MATNPPAERPNDDEHDGQTPPETPKKDEWFGTDEWLKITPPPRDEDLPNPTFELSPSSDPTNSSGKVAFGHSGESLDQLTEIIDVSDDVETPPPGVASELFPIALDGNDQDDEIPLDDQPDVQGPRSSVVPGVSVPGRAMRFVGYDRSESDEAASDTAESAKAPEPFEDHMFVTPIDVPSVEGFMAPSTPDLSDDAEVDLTAIADEQAADDAPSWLSRRLDQAASAVTPDAEDALSDEAPIDPEDALGGAIFGQPSLPGSGWFQTNQKLPQVEAGVEGPASGWLDSDKKLPVVSAPAPGSSADIGLGADHRDDASDIFSTARPNDGSVVPNELSGMLNMNDSRPATPPEPSSLFADQHEVNQNPPDESSLFAGMERDRGSSQLDPSSQGTELTSAADALFARDSVPMLDLPPFVDSSMGSMPMLDAPPPPAGKTLDSVEILESNELVQSGSLGESVPTLGSVPSLDSVPMLGSVPTMGSTPVADSVPTLGSAPVVGSGDSFESLPVVPRDLMRGNTPIPQSSDEWDSLPNMNPPDTSEPAALPADARPPTTPSGNISNRPRTPLVQSYPDFAMPSPDQPIIFGSVPDLDMPAEIPMSQFGSAPTLDSFDIVDVDSTYSAENSDPPSLFAQETPSANELGESLPRMRSDPTSDAIDMGEPTDDLPVFAEETDTVEAQPLTPPSPFGLAPTFADLNFDLVNPDEANLQPGAEGSGELIDVQGSSENINSELDVFDSVEEVDSFADVNPLNAFDEPHDPPHVVPSTLTPDDPARQSINWENATESDMGLEFLDPENRPDFDAVAQGQSGSNLLGDRTVVDIGFDDDDANVIGASGINLDDPEGTSDAHLGPQSSIFSKVDPNENSGGGRVDLNEIPLMGSSDDRTEAMFLSESQEHEVFGGRGRVPIMSNPLEPNIEDDDSASVFDMPSINAESDSGMIDWADNPEKVTNRLAGPSGTTSQGGSILNPSAAELSMPPDLDETGSVLEFQSLGEVAYDMPPTLAAENDASRAALPRSRPSARFEQDRRDASTEDLVPKETPSENRRGILVTALSLLTGVGLGAGGMFLSDTGSKPTTTAGVGSTTTATAKGVPTSGDAVAVNGMPTVEVAKTLLDSGSPALALKAYESITAQTPEVQAGRGQARWQNHLRTVATANGKLQSDDEALKAAQADLMAAYTAAAEATDPLQQQPGVKAALHLGQIQESLGNPDDALKLYAEAAQKFPASKRLFDANSRRVNVMMKKPDGSKADGFSRLMPPAEADLLASLTSILAEYPPVQDEAPEAAEAFFEAVDLAAKWDNPKNFDQAIKKIDEARARHDLQRKKFVGNSLNPNTDPGNQLFLRVCDELKNYWSFKKQIYSNPAGMALAKTKGGTSGAITEMLAASKNIVALQEERDAAIAASEKAAIDVKTLTAKATEAEAASKKLTGDLAIAMKDVVAKQTALTTATDALAVNTAKVAAADAALKPLISKLKAAKLLDDGLEMPALMAALPQATEKAIIVKELSGDTGKMAKEMEALRKQFQADLDKSTTAKDEAAKALADAKADAMKKLKAADEMLEKSTLAMAELKKTFDTKLETELDTAKKTVKADFETKLAEAMKDATTQRELAKTAQAALVTAKTDAETAAQAKFAQQAAALQAKLSAQSTDAATKLSAQAAAHEKELATARAGGEVPLNAKERSAMLRAGQSFANGQQRFLANDFSNAEILFAQATTEAPSNAVYWYFLGAARSQQGQDARADFQKAAEWELRSKPSRRTVSIALSGIQGDLRRTIESYRP